MKTTHKIQFLAALLLSLVTPFLSHASTEYISGQAGENEAKAYKSKVSNPEISSRYLILRDLGPWLAKVRGKSALDFGSGLGSSAEFLSTNGFKVQGVDINPHMIKEAQAAYPNIKFSHITNSKLPFPNKSFDLVFSSLVLFELNSKTAIQEYVEQAKRVLKDDGYFIAITGSADLADPTLKSPLRTADFPENYNATSGSLVRVYLNEIDLTFSDYLWFEKDYREIFAKAGLPICSVHYPLGKESEGYPWGYELEKAPFVLILAAKKCA